MQLSSSTFNKLTAWIRLNKDIPNTVKYRLSPVFKKFVQTLSPEEKKELIYDNWIDKDLELTDSGYKALTRMAELLH